MDAGAQDSPRVSFFGSLLQPLVSGKGAAPVQAAAIGPIHWRWWSRGQADVNAGSQHGDLSIAQSNLHPGLHPGLHPRTRHRAFATVRRHWRPPNRRHDPIGNGELRLGQPRIDTATNHVQCSRPHTFDVLRQVQTRPACRWALASRRLHRKGVRVTAWAAMAVLAVATVAAPCRRLLAPPLSSSTPWAYACASGSTPSLSVAATDRTGQALCSTHRGRVQPSSDARDHRQQ